MNLRSLPELTRHGLQSRDPRQDRRQGCLRRRRQGGLITRGRLHSHLWKLGQFFVCGTIRVAVGVKAALQNILVPTAGLDFEQLVKGRWATDIFE
jgi:hypothetical protein